MSRWYKCLLIPLYLILGLARAELDRVAKFPLQCSFNVTITAHQVNSESEDSFPPRLRTIGVYYDYVNKRGRADIQEGYEAAKVHLRRYDEGEDMEYMVRLPPIDDCKRSNLLEVMPYPLLPDTKFVKQLACPKQSGQQCDYFLFTDYETKVHIYMDSSSGAPVQLVHEVEVDEQDVPMLTYDYEDVLLGAPEPSFFELASLDRQVENCDLHAGGFPYLHVFHYFVKF